jgi:hypothetical protein
MFALLPLLLAAAPLANPTAPPPRATRVASATVQIIKLEPVSAVADPAIATAVDRQYRRRETMPLVDFY